MRGPVTSHRARFTALRLVFNRICKSIKKYKNVGALIFKASTFTGCNLFSQVLPYKPYGYLCQFYHVTCKTRAFGPVFILYT